MSEVFETTMLICFGFSWPMSVVKNIKSGTAKSMSLPFILLIIFGYLAGISAKIINGKINYVLAVYLINLVMVSINVVVYMINRKKDKTKEEERDLAMTKTIDSTYEIALNKFNGINSLAKKGGTVFFGTDFMAGLNVNELTAGFGMEENIYNRSIADMPIVNARSAVKTCILDLAPSKVFIEVSPKDFAGELVNYEDIVSEYEWLLYTVHTKTKAKLYLVVPQFGGKNGRVIYKAFESLVKEVGCELIDISKEITAPLPELAVFDRLKYFIRSSNIDFYSAMNYISVSNKAD